MSFVDEVLNQKGLIVAFLLSLTVIGLYLHHVNRGFLITPEEIRSLSPKRWTVEEIKKMSAEYQKSPVDVMKHLPPKQDRRYIVVGGSGLIGSWIVIHLLLRGENPLAIRVIDIRQRSLKSLISTFQKHSCYDTLRKAYPLVGYEHADISSEDSTLRAFNAAWPTNVAKLPLTIFHTAAVIRMYERYKDFLPRSIPINIGGTRNVISAAKVSGADVLISTSSASINTRAPRWWLPPWRLYPQGSWQIERDEDFMLEDTYADFVSNYNYTKARAEKLIRGEDDAKSGFRTGVIRPGNGVYGSGDDLTAGLFLKRGGSPTWMAHVFQNFVYVENISIAHLLYEQRLLELRTHKGRPDIGGQSYIVTDPNPAITFRDMHLCLETLANTKPKFPVLPPLPFFLMANAIELYAVIQHRYLSWLLPPPTGDALFLQPGTFGTCGHVILDDSRARLSPEEGGLGYNAPWTTLQGLCKQVQEWNAEHSDVSLVDRKTDGLVSTLTKPDEIVHALPQQL
ncbi:NAD(P)-binding protein [Lepidopterella palustris CBS 459.81]|uniref:NAD(P)-binding protein n=1 Tax=Lepidopterella palustris CBS 459.81 TaxID=1314670 RepID=A0A8E2EGU2_9PEZI|nr:NAD(P)-binding protein [Lepidopterella palustris CBS 459.81]